MVVKTARTYGICHSLVASSPSSAVVGRWSAGIRNPSYADDAMDAHLRTQTVCLWNIGKTKLVAIGGVIGLALALLVPERSAKCRSGSVHSTWSRSWRFPRCSEESRGWHLTSPHAERVVSIQ